MWGRSVIDVNMLGGIFPSMLGRNFSPDRSGLDRGRRNKPSAGKKSTLPSGEDLYSLRWEDSSPVG